MVSSMLPHEIGVVSDEPAFLHSTGQSEAQMHPDVVVQGAVIRGGVGAERAVPVCHLPWYDPAFVHKGTTLFKLPRGSWADDIIQPDFPVSSVVRVTGVNNLALDTTEDINNIPALNKSGFGALLRDSHHSFLLQDCIPRLYGFWVFARFKVLVVLTSGDEIAFSGVAPRHLLDITEVGRVVVGVGRPLKVWNMTVQVVSQNTKLEVILDGPGLTPQTLAQCLNCFFLVRSLGTGFLSHTLGLPRQGGAIIILQDNQVRGGFTSVALGLWLVRLVGKGFII